MFVCYILHSEATDKYYIGATADLQGRLQRHNTANHGFTAKGQPWKIVYVETFQTKQEAFAREKQLKAWKSRQRIIQFVKAGSVHPD